MERYNVDDYGSGVGGYGTTTLKYETTSKYYSSNTNDDIDQIIARYKGTIPSTCGRRYKDEDEPIVIFTDPAFQPKSSSRTRTYSSKPTSTMNISYDDLRARLFSDDTKFKY